VHRSLHHLAKGGHHAPSRLLPEAPGRRGCHSLRRGADPGGITRRHRLPSGTRGQHAGVRSIVMQNAVIRGPRAAPRSSATTFSSGRMPISTARASAMAASWPPALPCSPDVPRKRAARYASTASSRSTQPCRPAPVVDQSAPRREVGSHLLAVALQLACDRGVRDVQLTCQPTRVAVNELYRSMASNCTRPRHMPGRRT
jgi:hypothetical protein